MSRVLKDYAGINWSEHFFMDATSPSGLRWNRDVYQGFKKTPRYSIGDTVGTLNKDKSTNKPKAWQTSINRKMFYT